MIWIKDNGEEESLKDTPGNNHYAQLHGWKKKKAAPRKKKAVRKPKE